MCCLPRRAPREIPTESRLRFHTPTPTRHQVQSDNKFVEGVESLSIGGGKGRRRSSVTIREGEPGSHIERLHGVSKKGYAPYNPRKKNQDALHMLEDTTTGTQAILVLDGPGAGTVKALRRGLGRPPSQRAAPRPRPQTHRPPPPPAHGSSILRPRNPTHPAHPPGASLQARHSASSHHVRA